MCGGATGGVGVGGTVIAVTTEAFGISDEELTALALAADPDAGVDDDAVPFGSGEEPGGLLPSWYMPRPLRRAGRSRRVVFAVFIGALLVVNGAGLCVTYGLPEIPF
jgi:hypothetical protein